MTINIRGSKLAGAAAVPQSPELELVTPLSRTLSNNMVPVNEELFFSLEFRNIGNESSWSGEVILSLDSEAGSSYEIGRGSINKLYAMETATVSITVPANTITLNTYAYGLTVRSSRKVPLFGHNAPKLILAKGSLVNPLPVSLTGEKVKGLEDWVGEISETLRGMKEGASYLNTYVNYAKKLTPSYTIADQMLSEISDDLSKVKTLLSLESKARSHIESINMLNRAYTGSLSESDGFSLFSKVAGAAMKQVGLTYPLVAPIYSMYFDVLDKARERIINMGNYLFDFQFGSLLNSGDVCISIRVRTGKSWLEPSFGYEYFSTEAVSASISEVTIDGVPLSKCVSDCCGRGDNELFFNKKLRGTISGDEFGEQLHIMKVEWTNGRISWVPLTRDFASIQGGQGYGRVQVEFESERRNYSLSAYSHMADKIKLSYHGN